MNAAPLTLGALLAMGCAPALTPSLPIASAEDALAIAEAPWEPGRLPVVPGVNPRGGAEASKRPAGAGHQGPGPSEGDGLLSAGEDAQPATTAMLIDGGVIGHDPQVTVGDRFVLVYTAHRYQIHDRATGRFAGAEEGDEVAAKGSFALLFSPLWAPRDRHGAPNRANVNLRLHFAPGDPIACDAAAPMSSSACVQEFYDSRALWDPVRKRFWIESAARNHLWFCQKSDKEPCTDPKFTQTQARRFIAIAVSRTEDPRKGFHRYILVDEYSDWPKIGLQDRYLILGHRASSNVYVFDADKLAAGNPDHGPVLLAKLDQHQLGGAPFVTTVTHHGPTGGVTYLLGTDGSDRVTPIGLVDPGGERAAPPLILTGSSVSIGQRVGPQGVNPVFRDGRLYLTWNECVSERERCDYKRVRLVRFPASARLGASPGIDTSDDPARGFLSVAIGGREGGDVVDYQMPALDVNGQGDAVVAYTRRRRGEGPEARYSVLYHGEAAPRPGVLLRRSTESDVPDIDDNGKAGIDFVNAQVDPVDDRAVWITHVYADRDARWFKQVVAAIRP